MHLCLYRVTLNSLDPEHYPVYEGHRRLRPFPVYVRNGIGGALRGGTPTVISETYYDAFTSWLYHAASDRWDEAAKVRSRGLYDSAFGYQVCFR